MNATQFSQKETVAYRIRDWDKHFENSSSRKLKRLDWVALPIKMDGDGYAFLVDHPNGAAHFGAWIAIIEIAAKQEDRGTLPQGIGGISRSLGRISRLPAALFNEVIPRLVEIGWIEQVLSDEQLPDSVAESANASADSPDAAADVGRKAAAHNRTGQDSTGEEENHCAASAAPAPVAPSLEIVKAQTYGPSWFEAQHQTWYAAYWNKKNRPKSEKAYHKALLTLVRTRKITHEEAAAFLLFAIAVDRERFEPLRDWEWRQNMMPASWLNNARWEDVPQVYETAATKKGFVADVEKVFAERAARGESLFV